MLLEGNHSYNILTRIKDNLLVNLDSCQHGYLDVILFAGLKTHFYQWEPSEMDVQLLKSNPRRKRVTEHTTIGISNPNVQIIRNTNIKCTPMTSIHV